MSDPIQARGRNLGNLLLRAARLYDGLAFPRFAARHPDFRRAHLQLMPHLDLEGTRLTELAARAGITKQAVGQLVSDLEAAGYVEYRPDPTDGRAKVVTLTRKGRRGMAEGLVILGALGDELRDELGARRMDALVDTLVDTIAVLERKSSE